MPVPLIHSSTKFRKTLQYRKLVMLHGRRLAGLCVATLLFLLDEADGDDVEFPYADCMRLAEGADRRVKRRVLWAMEQCNILRRTPQGYRLWCLAQPPTEVRVARQPTAQMTLGLGDGPSGSRSTFEPGRVVLDPGALAADVEKAEQNQASDLARAVAHSSTESDVASPIDPAHSHTEVLQADVSQEATATGAFAPCLLPLKAQAKKPGGVPEVRGLPGGISRQQGACPVEAEPSDGPSRGLQPLARVIGRIMPSRCTVERAFEPPSRIEDLPGVTRPVNTQRVIKQQKVVRCRYPSSTAVSRDRMEGDLTPRTLYPTTAEIVSATREAWPHDPLSHKKAEEIMLKQTTWDELKASIEETQTRMGDGRARSPGVLVWMVDYVRQQAESKVVGKRPKYAPRTPDGGDRQRQRRAVTDGICEYMGRDLDNSHPLNMAYMLAFEGQSPDTAVSLYTEMRDEDSDADWQSVAEAFAMGRRPRRTGIKPSAPDPDAGKKWLARLWPDVQLPVDKSARAS